MKALSEIGVIFFTSAIAVTAAYTHSAVILSLGTQVAQDLIGSNNALVNGAGISLFAIVSGVVAMLAKQIPTRTAIVTDSFAHLVAQAGWSVIRQWISAAPHFAVFSLSPRGSRHFHMNNRRTARHASQIDKAPRT